MARPGGGGGRHMQLTGRAAVPGIAVNMPCFDKVRHVFNLAPVHRQDIQPVDGGFN